MASQQALVSGEHESAARVVKGKAALVVSALAVAWSLFQLYTGWAGPLPGILQRIVHLSFALALTFLLYPAGKRTSKGQFAVWDVLLAAASVTSVFYLLHDYPAVFDRVGTPNAWDVIFGIAATLFVLEATRRLMGAAMPLIALAFLLYAYFGGYLPGMLGHAGLSVDRIMNQVYLGTEGIFSMLLEVSATFLFLFVLFGAFLEETGVGRFIIEVAYGMFGRVRGGPAKVAVVASCMFGTMSGSAVANVVSTGTFTIPLMKRTGYKPHFAGAVEAVASSGGQLMPPIMGAGAFIMAEILGVPYLQIAAAAALPAILYYIALFVAVDLEAAKTGLRGLPASELPQVRPIFARGWHLLLPIGVLIYLLAIQQFSPLKSAFWSIVATVAVSLVRSETRLTLRKLLAALEKGARGMLTLSLATACMGVIVAVMNVTGLGFALSSMLIEVSQGNLIVLLLLTMITSLILGMGLPTVACYIILAVLVAPALTQMGVPPMAAHLFVFYFGIISAITPPVALAAYVGAGIAKADPVRTGLTATRLGIAGFIVPYMFVYGPQMVLIGSPDQIVLAALSGTIGVSALAAGLQGWMLTVASLIERALLIVAALALIHVGMATDMFGYVLVAVVLLVQVVRLRMQRRKVIETGVERSAL